MDLLNIPTYLSLFLALYMLVLFFIAFFEEHEKLQTTSANLGLDTKSLPKVAVIVPAYNEEDTIKATADSLLALKYPKDKLKIYVVDDGSKDNTLKVLKANYGNNANVVLLHKENGGKASAMNFAFSKLDKDTELVGVLDADSFVKEDALLEIVKEFARRPNLGAVTPAIKIWQPNRIIRFLQNAEYNLSIYLRKAFDNLGTIFIIPGPFSFYKKEVLDKAGPWKHAHGTEDLEMGLRFQSMGVKIGNTPKAVVYTVAPKTVLQLYKQRLRWVYGFLNNAIDYKSLFFNKDSKNKALTLFMLPSSVVVVFFAIYIFFFGIYSIVLELINKIERWLALGLKPISLTPDLFYINMSIILWFVIVLAIFSFIAMKLGDKISGDENLRLKDVLSYLLLYGLVAPVWLSVSLFKTLKRSEVKWVKVNK